jgi:pilus assembly protein FimV
MNMKRLLISLTCVLPLLILPTTSQSLDLTGPDQEMLLSSERYGPTESSDTLWAIATLYSEDNAASVYQALLAIYKSNPYMFDGGNPNYIFPNSTLIIPPVAFMMEQKNSDAVRLLKKYKRRAHTTTPKKVKTKTVATPVKVEKKVPVVASTHGEVTEKIETEVVPVISLSDEEAVTTAEEARMRNKKLAQLAEELAGISASQARLMAKNEALLQEITAQKQEIESLNESKNKLLVLNSEWQAKADAIVPSPFAGDGIVNEILRAITGSLIALLGTILLPLLILIMIFALISRKQSKKLHQQQEQELAESTVHTKDDASAFDSLLSDKTVLEADLEADLQEELQSQLQPIDETDELVVENDFSEALDERATETNDHIVEEQATDVPVVEEEVVIAVNDEELDPFGLGELTNNDEADDEVDDLVIAPKADVALEAKSQVESQADLDLAAQWEQELKNDQETTEVEVEAEAEAEKEASTNITEAEQADLDLARQWEKDLETKNIEEIITSEDEDNSVDFDLGSLDLDLNEEALDLSLPEENELPVLEMDDSDLPDALLAELAIEDIATEMEDEIDLLDIALPSDELLDDALATENKSNIESLDENDLLAEQLSQSAFNEDVVLPEMDDAEESGLIDIETLLENSNNQNELNPGLDFSLDFELEDFPDDVVNVGASASVDTDSSASIDTDEDSISEQLDLARAYLEIDDKEGAKEILTDIVEKSEGKQRIEIDKLLAKIN